MSIAKMKQDAKLKQSIHLIDIKAEKAMKKAVAKTIQDHARTGDPVAIWRDGKVVWVPAKTLIRQQSRGRKK